MKQGAVTAYARSRLAEYNPKGDPRLKGATTYQEYKAAEAVYNREFFRKFKGINPVLLQEEGIYEKQRDLQQDAYSTWTTGREEEIDTQRKQIAQSNFVKCVNSKGGGSCFIQYVNERGPFVQNGPARREAIEIAKNLADSGLMTDNMIKEMKAKNDKNKFTSFADGKEYYYGDYFAADIVEIEQKKADFENEKYRREKTGLEITHRNQTDGLLKELTPEDGFTFEEGFTQDQITQFKNLKANQLASGNYDGRIDTIISEMSLDKNQLKAAKEEALELAKKGLLTKEKLNTFPVLVASDGNLQNIAATIDAGNGQGKDHIKLLEARINSELTVGKGTFGEKQVALWAKSEYAKKVEKLIPLAKENGIIPKNINTNAEYFRYVKKNRIDPLMRLFNNLEKIGIELDEKKRVKTNASFQTNLENIYAIGDVTGDPMLAHRASAQGEMVAEIIAGQQPHIDHNLIPNVIYTWPEVAAVGKTEEELKAAVEAFVSTLEKKEE